MGPWSDLRRSLTERLEMARSKEPRMLASMTASAAPRSRGALRSGPASGRTCGAWGGAGLPTKHLAFFVPIAVGLMHARAAADGRLRHADRGQGPGDRRPPDGLDVDSTRLRLGCASFSDPLRSAEAAGRDEWPIRGWWVRVAPSLDCCRTSCADGGPHESPLTTASPATRQGARHGPCSRYPPIESCHPGRRTDE